MHGQEAQTNDKFLNSGATVDLFMEEKDQKVVNKIGHGAHAVVMRYLMHGIERARVSSIVVLSRRKSESPLQNQVGGISWRRRKRLLQLRLVLCGSRGQRRTRSWNPRRM